MKKQITQITVYCLLLFTLSMGCGYTTRSMISDKFTTIYVVPFVNKVDITGETFAQNKYRVYRPMLETDITGKVIDKYLFDGNLRPIREESADLTLTGELVEFRRDPLRYDDNENVTEYRINLVVNLTLWNNIDDKMVWQESNFTGDTTYFTTGSQAKSETQAVNDALDDLARKIVARTVEQW